ncbi:hypothetical protein X798_02954 [Onchocerca flexuosa]|uniref:Zf-C2H2_2 domain-containing protein n=2 Tax=Onchocerca flexuosa TaxID=387005 RepID=A0A183H2S0_9BILA|nr:hypothetical protein X798_02954 [Onchocerca flexuosa]VDO30752.1 unnamed protein product [Onchocerca flexuosa]
MDCGKSWQHEMGRMHKSEILSSHRVQRLAGVVAQCKGNGMCYVCTEFTNRITPNPSVDNVRRLCTYRMRPHAQHSSLQNYALYVVAFGLSGCCSDLSFPNSISLTESRRIILISDDSFFAK